MSSKSALRPRYLKVHAVLVFAFLFAPIIVLVVFSFNKAKSGTNKIHGTAAEYFRNSALDARNFFNTSDQPKAPFHNNQYGGSIGGPK